MANTNFSKVNTKTHVVLPADSNQALGIAQYAIDFMSNEPGKRGEPDASVIERTNLFHTDACLCGISAIALGTNAPNILRDEALRYEVPKKITGNSWIEGVTKSGATVFGSKVEVAVEKAIVANCAAVREWDSNGTNFGFNPDLGHTAGEFGHNDFYPVALAAAQMMGKDGAYALKGMILLDEIRGRLAEVFSLKTYKIDHVLHGAVASAATFGAMMGATAEQIESAIGMVVAHYVPFRAIRAGKQLSDSKGASAAISTEAAILCVKRSMQGFLGPRDIFRNPEAVYRIFEGPGQMFQKVGAKSANTDKADASPFDLVLARTGSDFAVMGMHFKLGLYEHQSAGALQGMINLVNKYPYLTSDQTGDAISKIVVKAYEPAFGIIGDPAKRDPKTRQSADHSMLYLVCTKLRKALELRSQKPNAVLTFKDLMLLPHDFDKKALYHPVTRALMAKMTFEHGGEKYDRAYPDGIPTSMVITSDTGEVCDSGFVMYPGGHARNANGDDALKAPTDLKAILNHKFDALGKLATNNNAKQAKQIVGKLSDLHKKSAKDVSTLLDFPLKRLGVFE
jgi:2-methylcitrate dehydratase